MQQTDQHHASKETNSAVQQRASGTTNLFRLFGDKVQKPSTYRTTPSSTEDLGGHEFLTERFLVNKLNRFGGLHGVHDRHCGPKSANCCDQVYTTTAYMIGGFLFKGKVEMVQAKKTTARISFAVPSLSS
ncbi:hypothetical protein FBULB1_2439 [Fusarium bulbicola]|nr:hypothetical protein FBULB1_2439 [Fusarium bulbicola]